MAATKYTYSVSVDFPNQAVAPIKFEEEIQASDIITALDGMVINGDDCEITFKDALSSGDETILDGLVAAHQGVEDVTKQDPNVSELGNLKVESQPPSGVRITTVSHDFTDPTTWYQESVAVEDEELEEVPNSSRKQFRGDHGNWIDLTHGKMVDEDRVNSEGAYDVVVKVNDVEKVRDKDYIIDYRSGTIKFEWRCCMSGLIMGMGAVDAEHVVVASYRYATSSVFKVQPAAGKILRVASVEVQFTNDCVISTNTIFAAFAYNPYDLPNKVEVPGTRNTYKTARDFISVGNRGVGAIPKFGGHIRGLKHETVVFPFDYKAAADLKSSQGAEIRLWLEGDEPHDGEYCTCTFYCVEEDE